MKGAADMIFIQNTKRSFFSWNKTAVVFAIALSTLTAEAQVLINEIQITNLNTLEDESGSFEDWIELYNAGPEAIDLEGYHLADELEAANAWEFPSLVLGAGQRTVVFASGNNTVGFPFAVHHLEVAVFPWNTWSYLIPTSQPASNWNSISFNDNAWQIGQGGIGYGDGDDITDIGGPVMSVYSRTSFFLSDPSQVSLMVLNMDYDDGFVCYLNGTEIARSNMGLPGVTPVFNESATAAHEAHGYQGLAAEDFGIDYTLFSSLLVEGENVLSFQVHNFGEGSSDLTGNPYLILGMANTVLQTNEMPEWAQFTIPRNHTDFGLSAGETVVLTNVFGEVLDSKEIPTMQSDHVLQRSSDGSSSWCFSANPTPAMENSNLCFQGYEAEPVFSVPAGAYPVGLFISITSPNPDAVIYYTEDGSAPDMNSILYTGPFAIAGSAVISAVCYSDAALPSPVKKNTYMINEFEIGLPVISISTNPDNLWDPVTGIHVLGPDYDPNYPFFGANFWEDWERTAYVEYFDASHTKMMEGPVGIKIHGGWSRGAEQKSLRIQAKGKYGMEEMNYPMIQDKPYIESFKGFNLRNGGNAYGDYRFHEALIERSMRETHVDYMAYAPVIVFLNGEYWGFMEIRENEDQHYIANNHDINASDATVVSANYMGFNVINGSADSFYAMHEFITQNDVNDPNYFDAVAQMLDIENYADYIIAETYWGNGDWSNGYQNNTKFWHDDRPGGKWAGILMDMDFGMGLAGASPYDNYIAQAGGDPFMTDQIFDQLIQNNEFRTYFINRYADLINTVFQYPVIEAYAHQMRDEVTPVFQRHSQRWGTYAAALTETLEQRLDWAELRVQGGRDVVQNHFSLSDQVDITLNVLPAGAGRIHISTIEPSELQYPWTGVYYNGVPVKISVVENPGFEFDHWLANDVFATNNTTRTHTMIFAEDLQFTAVFTGSPVEEAVAVTELMFHPDDQNLSGDWIEIHNPNDVALNLGGWSFKDSDYFNVFTFPENTFLDAGEYAILATDAVAFSQAYPSVNNIFGPLNFSFSNDTETLTLGKPSGEAQIQFTYTSSDGIALKCSDGCGHSRAHLPGNASYTPSAWILDCENGSPGAAFTSCDYDVIVSELNYNSSDMNNSDDWVELKNISGQDLNIGGWRLRDEGGNTYQILDGTMLNEDAYLVLVRNEADFSDVHPVIQNTVGPMNVALSNSGDQIKLYDASNVLIQSFVYAPSAPWPFEAAGIGKTLEYDLTAESACNALSWFAGCPNGSPGRAYDPTCSPVVNVIESEVIKSATIYPNPGNGPLAISSSAFNIVGVDVYDALGNLIYSKNHAPVSQLVMDASAWAKGVYSIKIKGDNGNQEVVRYLVQ
jgi:hypothetical protein